MNVKITNYLRNSLESSCYPVIIFKDKDFVSLTYDELLKDSYDIDKEHKLLLLLNKNEFNKLFGSLTKEENEKDNTVTIKCIVSYKTLKTKFVEQQRQRNDIPELTGVFYFKLLIKFTRIYGGAKVTYSFNKNDLPWYARSFMSSNKLKKSPDPCVASVENVDNVKEETTAQRAKISNWNDYVNYCEDFFNKTANSELEYESKYFIFRYDIDREQIVKGIDELYKKVEEDIPSHKLYNTFIDINSPNLKPLIDDSNIEDAYCNHCGQMNGKFHLAASQRQAVHHMNLTNPGEILAVSGPPGTGKTTLLQSIVADMVVKSALRSEKPPIIVATSANNQAVTNIIDSFSSVNKMGIENLEERWVEGVKSFATYMPSSTKKNDADKNRYQYTTISGREFLQDAEDSIDDSKLKMKKFAGEYFSKSFSTVDGVKQELENELLCTDNLRKQLLKLSAQINKIIGSTRLIDYITELNQLKTNAETEHAKYKERLSQWQDIYEKISKFKRFFSFVPSFKKQISNQLSIEVLPEETRLFNNDITFPEIQEKYKSKILEKAKEICSLENRIDEVEQLTKEIWSVLENLKDKNCCIELSDDNDLSKALADDINNLIDTKIRYIEFWLAVHINECRFLNKELTKEGNDRENFYRSIALLSPCFVMTVYKMPDNFKSKHNGYLFDFIDLLIFDEAGQCSPEIAAPQFSLAKKAIVVGDEYQIPPVYSLDPVMDKNLAIQNEVIEDDSGFDKFSECGLSCSGGSVMIAAKKSCKYELNNSDKRGLFLSEHRRCYDKIINYCNELVYNNLLKPMRGNGEDANENKSGNDEDANKKKRILNEDRYPLVGYHNISNQSSDQQGSSRRNDVEAAGISKWLKNNYDDILKAYKDSAHKDSAHKDSGIKSILAIITPFKAQVSTIREHLKSEMGEKAKNISVGTVHTFQGAERNIIIFSTVYGSGDSGKFIDNNKNLMNVAVSRAKDAFWVFGDIKFLEKSAKSPKTASGLLYEKIKNNPIE